MATGVPVLTDNHSGFREQIEHGQTGFLCSGEEDFSNDLLRLAKREAFRQRIATNARDALQTLADPTVIGGAWKRLFAEI
jgi:glycosyltransferase involved in cell wall biosynthesis